MKLIAITGGIGSGKSTVAKILQNLGYCVFDADIFSRDVLHDAEVESKVKSIFGEDVFLEKGVLNRDFVRQKIFEHPEMKKQLESILHPAIAELLNKKSTLLSSVCPDIWIFYEASLILENGKKNHFDACVVVTTKKELKISRLQQSRKLSNEQIHKIMSSQMPDEEKQKHADYSIENSGHFHELEQSVFQLIQFLNQRFKPSSF